MKYLISWQFIIFIVTIFIVIISIPIFGNAALEQDSTLNNTISIQSLNSKWLDGNEQTLNELTIPKHVSPGEVLDFNGGLMLKNTGIDSYARFKTELKVNGIETNLLELEIDENWIQGNDGWYYFISATNRAKVLLAETIPVIETITILDSFVNANSKDKISMEFIAEFVDAESIDWVDLWGENPPAEWFTNSGNHLI